MPDHHSPKIFYPVFYFCLILLGLLLYANTFEAPFLFDDLRYIRDNPNLKITQLTIPELWRAAEIHMQRPLANISLALNYYLHGQAVAGYHYLNTAVHILTASFLFMLLKTLLALPAAGRRPEHILPIALFSTLLWFVHPLATQSVTYIVQRMNSMAAMFYILSLWCYLRGRLSPGHWSRWAWLAGSLLAWLLSLGSKEIAVTLPFYLALMEFYFLQDLNRAWLKKWAPYLLAAVLLLGLLGYLAAGRAFLELNEARAAQLNFTTGQRVLTELRVVIYYLTLIFLPHPSRLFLDYDYPLSASLLEPATTLFSLAAVSGLLVLAVMLARKQRLFSFCILWFLGTLALESSFINLELIYEHRTYLPSMLVWPLVVALAWRSDQHKMMTVSFCCLIALFSFWTYQRNTDYGNEVVLWTKNANKFNNSPRIAINLGRALAMQGRLAEAKTQFIKTLQLDPAYPRANYDLANILAIEGRTTEAIKHYRLELQNNFDYPKCHYNLAYNLAQIDRHAEAIYHYQQAIRLKPDLAPYYSGLGLALFKLGNQEEAAVAFRQALSLQPDLVEALDNLGMTLAAQNKLDEAIRVIQQIVQQHPADPMAHFNLGNLFRRQHKIVEAIAHFQKAVELKPDFAQARQNSKLLRQELQRGATTLPKPGI